MNFTQNICVLIGECLSRYILFRVILLGLPVVVEQASLRRDTSVYFVTSIFKRYILSRLCKFLTQLLPHFTPTFQLFEIFEWLTSDH